MTYFDVLERYNRDEITARIYASTEADVERALASAPNVGLDNMIALLSPAADKYLENMAQLSGEITRRRFGKTIQLYVPLYISNFCSNNCVYCGFSARNKIKRAILTTEQLETELTAIKADPFEHILLVTGESPRKAGAEYIGSAIETCGKHFEQVSIETQPLETDEYSMLVDKGLHSVYVYQETYFKDNYPKYHLAGKKRDFRYRLETPDRLGQAGIYKCGIANLIGLEEWRTEAFFTALHLDYLSSTYWRTKYSIAFPRLRPFAGEGDFKANYPANERNLLQLICAYRLFSEDVELSISTRESAYFRDNVINLGVTTMSAGSKTAPGGYSDYKTNKELEQFEVNDSRSPEAVEAAIKNVGYEAVWKDWDKSLFAK